MTLMTMTAFDWQSFKFFTTFTCKFEIIVVSLLPNNNN